MSLIRIINDPFEVLFRIALKMKPDLRVDVQWNSKLSMQRKEYGSTTFPDVGIPLIDINPELSVINAVEILAHELAHVVAGANAGHGEQWENVFDEINEGYNHLMSRPKPNGQRRKSD